jgi:hypothetical protein
MTPRSRADPPLAEAVDLDRALDEVFSTPPEGFVKARDAVVKRLRAEKRRDDAAAVAGLRKPNRLVWALDQLALSDDPTLGELLEAVDDVRDARGGDLRVAVEGLRDAVRAAAAAAGARLEPSRPTDRADLGAALNAAVADAEALEALRIGRLLEIPAADPFGLGVAPAPTTGRGRPAEEKPPATAGGKAKAKSSGKGKANGRSPGEAEGKAEGKAEGEAEGEAEGKAEGKAEGEAEPSGPDTLALRRARHDAEAVLEAARQASADAQDGVREAAAVQDDAEAALEAAKAAHRAATEALEAAQVERDAAAAVVDDALEVADQAAADEEAATAALEAAVKAESS